jgi:hypothetical protein
MFSDGSVHSTKSKAKCYTCRRQRIVCDGGKPSCMRCISRGVECLGYSATPIRWVAPTSTLSSDAPKPTNISVAKDQERRKRGRPKLLLMQGAPQSSSSFQSNLHRSDKSLDSPKGTHEWKPSGADVTGELSNRRELQQAFSGLARYQAQKFLRRFFHVTTRCIRWS